MAYDYAERYALRKEIKEMAESHRQEMEGLRQTLEVMRMTMLDQTKTIAELTSQLSNARASEKMNRGKRFAPSTEQRVLLNNRRTDSKAVYFQRFVLMQTSYKLKYFII